MSMRCAVPGCSNVQDEDGLKTFLPAPKQKTVRDEWFRVLGVPDTVGDVLICEDHFEVDDKSEGGYESAASPMASADSDVDAGPEATNLKRKSDVESKLPFKKKMLFEHRNSNLESATDDVVQASRSNQSSSRSSPVSLVSECQERSECSESAWSVREGPMVVNDDSCGSGELLIKSEPEDDGYEENERNSEEYFASNVDLGNTVKVEASPMELHYVLSEPFLEIVDQPETSYRFRYKRESAKPHGPLKGRSCVSKPQKLSHGPTVMLRNFHGREAVIRVWLFCGKEVSPHQLVATESRGLELKYEPHEVHVTSRNGFMASFDKMNILHVVCGEHEYQRRYYEKKLFSKSNSYYPPPKLPHIDFNQVKEEVRKIEKDIVCLFFEAFEKTDSGFHKICESYSDVIKNKKSPKTNDLKIVRQSHEEGSCRGNQLLMIFTEKLIKDVNVEFFEEDESGQIIWQSKASFKESDIHKQVAICFWTPPYKDLHIKRSVPVFFRLVRKTDGATSQNRTYRYTPADCPCKSSKARAKVPHDVHIGCPRQLECTSPDKVKCMKNAGVQANLDRSKLFKTGVPATNSTSLPNNNTQTTLKLKLPAPIKPVLIAPKPGNIEKNPMSTSILNLAHTVNEMPLWVKRRIERLKKNGHSEQKSDSNLQFILPKLQNNVLDPVEPSNHDSLSGGITMDRKLVQLPIDVFQKDDEKYLTVHLPAMMFNGIPTPPEPAGTLTPLSVVSAQAQPDLKKHLEST